MILHHRIDDVANPGLWGLVQFYFVGKEIVDFRVVRTESPDVVQLQLLILWDLDPAHLVAFDDYSQMFLRMKISVGTYIVYFRRRGP